MTACAQEGGRQYPSDFEGKICYRVSVYVRDNSVQNEYLSRSWGDTMEVYHLRTGHQKRVYYNAGYPGFEWGLYDVTTNTFFNKWNYSDTVYLFDCSSSTTKLRKIDAGPEETVMDKSVKSLVLELYDPIEAKSITTKALFDEDLKLDPGKYRNFRDNSIDQIYNFTRSHLVKWSIDNQNFVVTFEAFDIQEMMLDEALFAIPKNVPMAEL